MGRQRWLEACLMGNQVSWAQLMLPPLTPTPTRSCQVMLPLSQAEIGELSEGVLADQKKLMEAAPTEWNSGPGRTAKEAAIAAKKRGADAAAAGERQTGSGGVDGVSGGSGGEDRTGLADQQAGGDGAGVIDDTSSLGLLYRLLLAEMQGNGSSGGLNNRWIDRDALLQVRYCS